MQMSENVRIAWEGIKANKMRSALTMLGIIIGIASVIGILTTGNGMTNSVAGQMSSLGSTSITVSVQEITSTSQRDPMMSTGQVDTNSKISQDMIDNMQVRFGEDITGVSLTESIGSGQVKQGRDYANVSITGINEDYTDMNSVEIVAGRTFQESDIDNYRKVAIVSDKLVDNLFDGDTNEAIGSEISVYVGDTLVSLSIVGIYEYDDSSSMMPGRTSTDESISTSLYLPVSTAKRTFSKDLGYASITVAASTQVDVEVFSEQLAEYLNIYYEKDPEYYVSTTTMASMLDTLNTMLSTMSLALSVIAGISLLVGGVGVMNIMLVTVTERTREIGVRKALGATSTQIRVQFVTEGMIVCLIGGFIGVIFGGILGYVGSSFIGAATYPTVSHVALALIVSVGVGVFFGYYPANKAAQLDPIEALRYE